MLILNVMTHIVGEQRASYSENIFINAHDSKSVYCLVFASLLNAKLITLLTQFRRLRAMIIIRSHLPKKITQDKDTSVCCPVNEHTKIINPPHVNVF